MTDVALQSSDVPVFDLYSTEIDANPFPYYAALRDHHPCYWHDRNGVWILSRYADVFNAAQDWKTFSSSQGNLIDELPGRAGGTLGTTDPPRHDRLRALAESAFLKRNVEHLAEPTRRVAAAAVDEILARGTFDFVADFSSRVTVGIIFQMMGLPARDHAEIRRKVVLSISTDKGLRGHNEEQTRAFKELGEFIAEQVAAKRKSPTPDVVTALATAEIDGDRLSDREVMLTSATFVMAGVESLSSFMNMFALNLHDHPDERAKVLRDWSLLAPAIEESLRFNTSAQRFKRVAARDIELHGQRIKAGDRVALAYGAANRDGRKFPDPDRYNVERRPQGHLGFGGGVHFCLGNQLARLVTAAAMREFLERIPAFRLTRTDLAWTPSSNFRSPVALPFAVG